MKLPKAQKAALLYGAFFAIFDQISDVWMGLNYYFNCHYYWSMISFILTFQNLLSNALFHNLTCYQDIKTRCITTIQVIFSPFMMVYYIIEILKSDDQNAIFEQTANIKFHKMIELGESLSQFV